MLDVKTWVRGKLAANTPLLTLLGSTNQILFQYPNDFENLPVLIFSETNQPPAYWVDDQTQANESTIALDAYVGDGQDTTPISQAIDTVLVGLGFGCQISTDVPDPDSKIHHRHMRYSRVVTPQDLV